MPKTINDLYAESQLALNQANLAHYEAVQVIAMLIKGELQPAWFTLTESGGNISYSWQKPDAQPDSTPTPNEN